MAQVDIGSAAYVDQVHIVFRQNGPRPVIAEVPLYSFGVPPERREYQLLIVGGHASAEAADRDLGLNADDIHSCCREPV